MRTFDSGSRLPWLDLVIAILKFLLSLLSGAGGAIALAVTYSPSVQALDLDPASKWFWILTVVALVLAGAAWAFDWWRKNHQDNEDDLLDQVLDFVQWVLDALIEETGKRLREIPQEVVEEAARQVYRAFIANSPLSIVPEDVFVDFVVARWKDLAGVEAAVRIVAVQHS